MSDVITEQLQIALFPKDFIVPKTYELALALIDVEGLDKATIKQTDLPSSAPANINRFEISTKDKSFSIVLNGEKINIYWTNVQSNTTFTLPQNWKDITNTILSKLSLHEYHFNRVGYITRLYKKIPVPSDLVKSTLLQSHVPDGLTHYDSKMIFRMQMEGRSINKHVSIITGRIIKTNEKVLVVQQDINTLQKDKLDWSLDQCYHFITKAKEPSAPEIFQQFFP